MKQILIHAVTEYDRKQSAKRGWNPYALTQYRARIEEVDQEPAPAYAAFTGRMLDVCLKAVGQAKSTDNEQMGEIVYTPISKRNI